MQQQQQQPPAPPLTAASESQTDETAEAPPKQVALALDRLTQAGRLIADIRIGADRLLEILSSVGSIPLNHQVSKPLQLILQDDASMRQRLQDLRTIGKQLEDSGVLSESLRARSNSWGLHMPLICPDGAVVAYAWKRQLAGQAGASAVDRTRLALKAFSDQKKRFFPHLDGDSSMESCKRQAFNPLVLEELRDKNTVPDILKLLEKEVPDVKSFTYQRLDWLKRASVLPSEKSLESSEDNVFRNQLRQGSTADVTTNKVAVVELLFPSIFRVIVSLHPAGSTDPDSVAFFSPDEGGSYVHARGISVYHVFKYITQHASMALQHFSGLTSETALYVLLNWICSYQSLFTKGCSKCGRFLSMDKQSGLFLPPVSRPYRNLTACNIPKGPSAGDRGVDVMQAFHVGCFSEEA